VVMGVVAPRRRATGVDASTRVGRFPLTRAERKRYEWARRQWRLLLAGGGFAGLIVVALAAIAFGAWFLPLSAVAAALAWRLRRRSQHPLAAEVIRG
jgi:hypothetical protein